MPPLDASSELSAPFVAAHAEHLAAWQGREGPTRMALSLPAGAPRIFDVATADLTADSGKPRGWEGGLGGKDGTTPCNLYGVTASACPRLLSRGSEPDGLVAPTGVAS